jgi:hypothetical protein
VVLVARNGLAAQLAAVGVIPTASSAISAMQLDPVPLAPGLARRFVGSHLEGVSMPQRDAALLLASELVTSVVLHARTSLEIAVGTRDGDVVLAVRDHDPGADDAVALRGRTKALVIALADEHGTMSEQRCQTVWLVLREHGRAATAGALEASTHPTINHN